jgi:hypothetical protein
MSPVFASLAQRPSQLDLDRTGQRPGWCRCVDVVSLNPEAWTQRLSVAINDGVISPVELGVDVRATPPGGGCVLVT